MTAPLFPYLPGLTFPVDRSSGLWDTSTQVSVSGKETRFANRTQARYQYSIPISGLDSSGLFPTLNTYSKQALEGLFNSTLGGALIFNFWDQDDCSVIGQQFGTTDGVTTAFQLYRATASGWYDAVFAPVISGGSGPVAVNGDPAGAWAPNNLLENSADFTQATWAKYLMTAASGNGDPFGGTTGGILTATGPYASVTTTPQGISGIQNSIFSCWIKSITVTGPVWFVGASGAWTPVPITHTWTRVSIPSTSSGAAGIAIINSGDSIRVYGPQFEANNSAPPVPGAYLATGASPYYGDPEIYVAGTLQTSGYTVSSSGLVTFTTAPTSGQALTWTGSYWWPCNFDDDTLALSKFMGGLWEAKSVKFTTRIY